MNSNHTSMKVPHQQHSYNQHEHFMNMPSVAYLNQMAPMWDYLAHLENQGHPWFANRGRNGNGNGKGNGNRRGINAWGPNANRQNFGPNPGAEGWGWGAGFPWAAQGPQPRGRHGFRRHRHGGPFAAGNEEGIVSSDEEAGLTSGAEDATDAEKPRAGPGFGGRRGPGGRRAWGMGGGRGRGRMHRNGNGPVEVPVDDEKNIATPVVSDEEMETDVTAERETPVVDEKAAEKTVEFADPPRGLGHGRGRGRGGMGGRGRGGMGGRGRGGMGGVGRPQMDGEDMARPRGNGMRGMHGEGHGHGHGHRHGQGMRRMMNGQGQHRINVQGQGNFNNNNNNNGMGNFNGNGPQRMKGQGLNRNGNSHNGQGGRLRRMNAQGQGIRGMQGGNNGNGQGPRCMNRKLRAQRQMNGFWPGHMNHPGFHGMFGPPHQGPGPHAFGPQGMGPRGMMGPHHGPGGRGMRGLRQGPGGPHGMRGLRQGPGMPGPHHGPPPPPGVGPMGGPQNMRRFGALAKMFREQMNLNADGTPRGGIDADVYQPDVDVFDGVEAFTIHASLPGASKEDIEVNWDTEKSELIISGEMHRLGEDDEEFLKTLAMDERKIGKFERKVRLGSRASPAHVDVEGITARIQDGVLVVEVPKAEAEFVEVKKVDIE